MEENRQSIQLQKGPIEYEFILEQGKIYNKANSLENIDKWEGEIDTIKCSEREFAASHIQDDQ